MTAKYLNTKQAAEYVGLSPDTLHRLRVTGGGPLFARLGRSRVVYRVEDIDQWVEDRLCRSTSDYERLLGGGK